jgi:hypothetical protein
MTIDNPQIEPEQIPQVRITGLDHVSIDTLRALVSQLHEGANRWRYRKRARLDLADFAKAFEAELERRNPAIATIDRAKRERKEMSKPTAVGHGGA